MVISLNDVHDDLNRLLGRMMKTTGVLWDVNPDVTSGVYNYTKNVVLIGGECLNNMNDSGIVREIVSDVDYVSMSKQCFHEYRHWWQHNKLFTKQDTDGMSSELIETMAVQSMIADVFPNYVRDVLNPFVRINYYNMIMEIDAEQYALLESRKYLLEDGLLSPDVVDMCLREEIQRRTDWWGIRPVLSIEDAICDLEERKNNSGHLSLVGDYESRSTMISPVYSSFMRDSGNISRYLSMSDAEQDQFLVDYICKHNANVAKHYSLVLGDRMPGLSGAERLKRRSYMITHNIFDENQVSDVHNKRISDLDNRFGNIGGSGGDYGEFEV